MQVTIVSVAPDDHADSMVVFTEHRAWALTVNVEAVVQVWNALAELDQLE